MGTDVCVKRAGDSYVVDQADVHRSVLCFCGCAARCSGARADSVAALISSRLLWKFPQRGSPVMKRVHRSRRWWRGHSLLCSAMAAPTLLHLFFVPLAYISRCPAKLLVVLFLSSSVRLTAD